MVLPNLHPLEIGMGEMAPPWSRSPERMRGWGKLVRPMFIREREFRGPEGTNKKVAKCIVRLNTKIC